MRERLERQIHRDLQMAEGLPSSSIPLGQSVFTQMDSEDRAAVIEVAGQSDVSPEEVLDLFGQLYIHIRPPLFTQPQLRYVLVYITAAVSVGDYQSRLADPNITTAQREELTKQIQAESDKFSAFEDIVTRKLPRGRGLKKKQMGFLRYIAEEGYRHNQMAKVIEREYPLDIEHSAIPAMSFQQIYQLLDIGDEITICIALKGSEIERAVKNRMIKTLTTKEPGILEDELTEQLKKQLKDESKEQTAADFKKAFLVENAPLPQQAQELLTKLGLNELKDPVHIRYAFKYINTVAILKVAEISPWIEESGVDFRRSFAQTEADNQDAMHPVSSISRVEMMQIKEAIEEAFRTHPEALPAFQVVPPTDFETDQ